MRDKKKGVAPHSFVDVSVLIRDMPIRDWQNAILPSPLPICMCMSERSIDLCGLLTRVLPLPRSPHSYTWHLPKETSTFMVFVPGKEVLRDNGTALLAKLWAYTDEEVASMRANVVNLIPRIVYAAPGHNLTRHRDAFEVAVESVWRQMRGRVGR